MITKLDSIKNLAVFKDFEWDSYLRDDGNNVVKFNNINIFYGRNYSGKTTLSRIIRALETGKVSDKYENPEFKISFKDTPVATHADLLSHNKKVRVFNEDFIRDNLKFITNPDDSITPFAILGGNTKLEEEIQELKNQLGKSEEGHESGLYLEYKRVRETSKSSKQNFDTASHTLELQLSEKATNRVHGIKYNADKFGDQNYNKPKLENDIKEVLRADYKEISDEEQNRLLSLINERVKPNVAPLPAIILQFNNLSEEAERLITKKIGDSDKINQLVKNSILNRWVKEGRNLHKDKLDNCAFCGSKVPSERWIELDKHFDEESENLERDIIKLIQGIEEEIKVVSESFVVTKDAIYSAFHPEIDRVVKLLNNVSRDYKNNLNRLKTLLSERKNDLLNVKAFTEITDCTKRLGWVYSIFEHIGSKSNEYSNLLLEKQVEAKLQLRLREVSEFIKTIQYKKECINIESLREIAAASAKKLVEIDEQIKAQITLIEDRERLMKDEEKGAKKVNEYLNSFFGHNFLTLQAIEDELQDESKKQVKFEIVRNEKKAHHLSEGECSLIAFCYFMAKLDDIETQGSKPIIWIDDPICSLDNNHIFFVYSLINAEIVWKERHEQLFISTHNLDFLKYLKRLPGALNNKKSAYFIVLREDDSSVIKIMPKYLKDYVTEFNFLFHQIYKCANAELEGDEQFNLYYNFANNTRKFLEAFLFYKYPNAIDKDDKLVRFFGGNQQAASMTDRINNEYSHLEALFERSMIPIDIPEMRKVAKFILDKINEKDNDQYEALLTSIGVEVTVKSKEGIEAGELVDV